MGPAEVPLYQEHPGRPEMIFSRAPGGPLLVMNVALGLLLRALGRIHAARRIRRRATGLAGLRRLGLVGRYAIYGAAEVKECPPGPGLRGQGCSWTPCGVEGWS